MLSERKKLQVTMGMANSFSGKGKFSCDDCGLVVPKYTGAYPIACPNCGGKLEPIVESIRGLVKRIRTFLDEAAPRALKQGDRVSNLLTGDKGTIVKKLSGNDLVYVKWDGSKATDRINIDNLTTLHEAAGSHEKVIKQTGAFGIRDKLTALGYPKAALYPTPSGSIVVQIDKISPLQLHDLAQEMAKMPIVKSTEISGQRAFVIKFNRMSR